MSNTSDIHVLHVVPGLLPGGMELTLTRVIRGLLPRGVRHSVACLKGDPALGDAMPPEVDVHCMHSTPNEPGLPWRLRGLIRRVRPTLIHARNWGAWPDIAAARLLTCPVVPLVFSFHGFADPGQIPLRRRIAHRVLARMTTSLFTVSGATRQMLVERLGWPAGRTAVIPNGVDTERFCPSKAEADPETPGKFVIGTTGGLTPVKNQAMLIRAVARLRSDGIPCRLEIAGEGPLRSELETLISEVRGAEFVTLQGRRDDVPEFLRSLDVFVLPSHSEAHPNALIEAMACGLPCMATRVGGVPEVLGDGAFGRLVDADDEAALAGSLAELSRATDERRRLGVAARQRVCDRYSLARMIDAYAELYERVSRPPGTRRQASTAARGGKPRVLMLAPLPPLRGGMATVAENLRRSPLRECCDLAVRQNGKTTPEGRSLVSGIKSQVGLLSGVLRHIRSHKTQLIHIHTCALFSFWRDSVHRMACGAFGVPVVFHIHDGSFEGFLRDAPRVKRRLIERSLRAAAGVIVLSQKARDALEPLVPEARWHVVPNGVAIQPEAAAPPEIGRVRLLFLGNLTRRKGAYDLVEAASRAMAAGADLEVELAGGEVEPGQREALESFIRDQGVEDRVRLIGFISGEAKDAAFARSHCLVLPSYAEGLPMVVLEAMSCGRPVIATRVGAVHEAVTDGEEGFLLEPGDVDTLADRIAQVARDPASRDRMGRKARRRAEAEFSIEAMVRRIMAIYEGIINGTEPTSCA